MTGPLAHHQIMNNGDEWERIGQEAEFLRIQRNKIWFLRIWFGLLLVLVMIIMDCSILKLSWKLELTIIHLPSQSRTSKCCRVGEQGFDPRKCYSFRVRLKRIVPSCNVVDYSSDWEAETFWMNSTLLGNSCAIFIYCLSENWWEVTAKEVENVQSVLCCTMFHLLLSKKLCSWQLITLQLYAFIYKV